MKKVIGLMLALSILAFVLGCTPSTGPSTSGTKLAITAVKMPYGIQLSAAKVAAKGLARDETIVTYDSPDADVVVVNPDPIPNPIPTTAVAVLDATTGIVTPVGPTPATITITASDGTNYGSTEVTTSVINLAGSWKLRLDAQATALGIKDASSFVMTFSANVDPTLSPERVHSNGVVYNSRLNAGFYTTASSTEKRAWEAVDGHLSLPGMMVEWVDKATGTIALDPANLTVGDSGAYDDACVASEGAMRTDGQAFGFQSPAIDFAIDGSGTLTQTAVVSGTTYTLTFDPQTP